MARNVSGSQEHNTMALQIYHVRFKCKPHPLKVYELQQDCLCIPLVQATIPAEQTILILWALHQHIFKVWKPTWLCQGVHAWCLLCGTVLRQMRPDLSPPHPQAFHLAVCVSGGISTQSRTLHSTEDSIPRQVEGFLTTCEGPPESHCITPSVLCSLKKSQILHHKSEGNVNFQLPR